jgi:hypothetical protein
VTAAGVAGATAAAMYIDGRYHIRKDLRTLLGLRRAGKLYQKAGEQLSRVSLSHTRLTENSEGEPSITVLLV